jgi:hypothetical protein
VRKIQFISFFGILLSFPVFAQLGGSTSFEFLNVPANARVAASGGVNVSWIDRDVTFFLNNPALVNDSLAGYAAAGYTFYVADIGQSTFAYAHHFKTLGTVSFGVQHMGYGEITGYDDSGLETGSFKSGETALVISKSHQVSSFRAGASIKAVFSNIAGFRSSAVMLDLGGTFVHPEKDLTVGLVIRNFGVVLSEYSETSTTKVPFDVQAGVTFKPEHMALRVSLTAYNLAAAGKAYDNPADEGDDVGFFKQLMQHLAVGTEVLIHRHVNVLLGYNVLKQQELKTLNSGGGGFTFGAALKIKSVDVVISRNRYTVGNAAYAFSVMTNLNTMILKKKNL